MAESADGARDLPAVPPHLPQLRSRIRSLIVVRGIADGLILQAVREALQPNREHGTCHFESICTHKNEAGANRRTRFRRRTI